MRCLDRGWAGWRGLRRLLDGRTADSLSETLVGRPQDVPQISISHRQGRPQVCLCRRFDGRLPTPWHLVFRAHAVIGTSPSHWYVRSLLLLLLLRLALLVVMRRPVRLLPVLLLLLLMFSILFIVRLLMLGVHLPWMHHHWIRTILFAFMTASFLDSRQTRHRRRLPVPLIPLVPALIRVLVHGRAMQGITADPAPPLGLLLAGRPEEVEVGIRRYGRQRDNGRKRQ